jgi:acyl-CoA thioesterase FadM
MLAGFAGSLPWAGIMQGEVASPIIAVVLDEAMGKLSKMTDERAVTAEMSIEYRKPVPVDLEIVVEGWQEEEKGRNRFRTAEIRDLRGNLLARGKGRFVVISEEHFAGVTAER